MSNNNNEQKLRIIIFQEDGFWYAKGIDYNIMAHAEDKQDLPKKLMNALAANIRVAAKHNQELFEGLPPTQEKYVKMFEQGVPVDDIDFSYKPQRDMPNFQIPEVAPRAAA